MDFHAAVSDNIEEIPTCPVFRENPLKQLVAPQPGYIHLEEGESGLEGIGQHFAFRRGHGGVKADPPLFSGKLDSLLISRVRTSAEKAKEGKRKDGQPRFALCNHFYRQISAISLAVATSKWVCSMSFKAISCRSRFLEPTQSFRMTMSYPRLRPLRAVPSTPPSVATPPIRMVPIPLLRSIRSKSVPTNPSGLRLRKTIS